MASRSYNDAITRVLRHEGGYVNHPSDRGGATNYGITQATARAHGYTGDMRSLPLSTAKAIYRSSYWDAVSGDALPAGVDYCVFDYAVNSGVGRARRVYNANRKATPAATINAICDERMAFLQQLRTWPTFGKGWTRRVSEVRSHSLAMAGGRGGAAGSIVVGGGGLGGATIAKGFGADAGTAIFIGIVLAVAVGVGILILRRRRK